MVTRKNLEDHHEDFEPWNFDSHHYRHSVPRTGGIQDISPQSKPNAKLSTNTTDTIN